MGTTCGPGLEKTVSFGKEKGGDYACTHPFCLCCVSMMRVRQINKGKGGCFFALVSNQKEKKGRIISLHFPSYSFSSSSSTSQKQSAGPIALAPFPFSRALVESRWHDWDPFVSLRAVCRILFSSAVARQPPGCVSKTRPRLVVTDDTGGMS